ncbi:MAG TPA: primosomal protein N', partial [Candidatus Agrococcus pullicola]|nr:primosomal protein N' [Candidatus Agrococcus pullicola]
MAASVARVLLDSRLPQLDRLLDFRVPEALQDDIAQGVRVRVPLRGGRLAAGYVAELTDASDYAGELEDIERVVSPTVALHPEVLELAR